MRVAIIGAGLAGLACAIELEKHKIYPVIYERNSIIGEQHQHVTATLEVAHRPINDPIKYYKKLGIKMNPLNTIDRLVHCSPNKTAEMTGNFGYFFERGVGPLDVKNQMVSQLSKTNILFDTYGDYQVLSKEYDHVLVCTGEPSFTQELGCWQTLVDTMVRGAIILGDFDPKALIMWLNKDYCKNGYAYLTPFNEKKASAILIVTDVTDKEMDYYWELFLYTENIKNIIVEEFKLPHIGGRAYPLKVGNVYFAGNSAGAIDPFLGFGQMNSITMGVMAARSMVTVKDYSKLIRWVIDQNDRYYIFRKTYNTATNNGYDATISTIGLPGVKQLIYHTPLNIVKLGAAASKLRLRFRRKKRSLNRN